ncbi:MAG TPA: deoxyribose-phosphate aldolase [bacterium]|nr:deoxyribose-phosphate aldolase [bacterium]
MNKSDLAKKIQYTNVRADATENEIRQHCKTAAEYGFQGVMLQPCWISLAKEVLGDTHLVVASALVYPMGGETTAMKVGLARHIIDLGADEFDFMPNIGFLKSGMVEAFQTEIRQVVDAADGRPVKSMSEFGFLTEEEKISCITLSEKAGVSYIKNSSGIGPGGSPATSADIQFIKQHLKGQAKIKASGGIRSYEQAMDLLRAGADLIGTSAAHAVVDGIDVDETDY